MRKVFLHMIVSVDGFIEGPNHELDRQFVDDEFERYINDLLRSIGGMFFGRVAYERLAGYWPHAGSQPSASTHHIEAARMMNALPKYVVSGTVHKISWNNSHIVRGDIAAEVSRLKEQPGKDLALFAGAKLASTFIRLRLLDELRLVMNPALIGRGTRLFKDPQDMAALRLREARVFDSGAVLLSYGWRS